MNIVIMGTGGVGGYFGAKLAKTKNQVHFIARGTHLDAINKYAQTANAPWELSFSYGRGLQAAPLNAWQGKQVNMEKAQNVFFQRALVTSAARNGAYNSSMEAV